MTRYYRCRQTTKGKNSEALPPPNHPNGLCAFAPDFRHVQRLGYRTGNQHRCGMCDQFGLVRFRFPGSRDHGQSEVPRAQAQRKAQPVELGSVWWCWTCGTDQHGY